MRVSLSRFLLQQHFHVKFTDPNQQTESLALSCGSPAEFWWTLQMIVDVRDLNNYGLCTRLLTWLDRAIILPCTLMLSLLAQSLLAIALTIQMSLSVIANCHAWLCAEQHVILSRLRLMPVYNSIFRNNVSLPVKTATSYAHAHSLRNISKLSGTPCPFGKIPRMALENWNSLTT